MLHLKGFSRRYTGESDAAPLVRWLNQAESSSNGERLTRVIEKFKEVEHLNEELCGLGRKSKLSRPELERLKTANRRHSILVQELSSEVRKYTYHHFLDHTPGNIGWLAFLEAEEQLADFSTIEDAEHVGHIVVGDTFREGDAVSKIVTLARAGSLNRVRQCEKCGRWFFARFTHQKFDDRNCQQVHFRSREEWKVRRREWMREYRQLKQSGKVK